MLPVRRTSRARKVKLMLPSRAHWQRVLWAAILPVVRQMQVSQRLLRIPLMAHWQRQTETAVAA